MNAFTVKTAKNELSITQNSNNWPILVGSKGEHKIEAFNASTQKLTFWVGDETLASCALIEGGALVEAMIAASKKRAKLVRIEANSLACANKVASKNKKMAQHFNVAIHMCAINMTNRTPAHRSADSRYNNKRDVRRVSFNTQKAEDIERLRKLEQIPDFTNWVKSKIDELPA